MTTRRTLRRLHLWLAWIVGVPILFWMVSGLWMVARPIEEVRGTTLRAPAAALVLPPRLTPPSAARALTLEMQAGRPVWIATLTNGAIIRADVTTGQPLPGPDGAEARTLARTARIAAPAILGVTRTTAAAPPLELRRQRPAWQIRFADDTHVYIDAQSDAVLALRTAQWRWFDWMWGLHIMDLGGREDTHHALLIGFAALALAGTVTGLVLLPLSVRRRRRANKVVRRPATSR